MDIDTTTTPTNIYGCCYLFSSLKIIFFYNNNLFSHPFISPIDQLTTAVPYISLTIISLPFTSVETIKKNKERERKLNR
jgi:hypothetical protein